MPSSPGSCDCRARRACRRPCRRRPCRSASRNRCHRESEMRARWPPARSRRPADARWRARRWRPAAAARSPSKPAAGTIGDDLRLAFGQRAGLVDDERVDLLHALQRFGVLDQHAGLRAAADADHDRHRRGEAERTGAGDDEHGDGGDQAVGEARLGPNAAQATKASDRDDDDGRHEPAGHLVGQPLDRRAAALRLRDHLRRSARAACRGRPCRRASRSRRSG